MEKNKIGEVVLLNMEWLYNFQKKSTEMHFEEIKEHVHEFLF